MGFVMQIQSFNVLLTAACTEHWGSACQ